MEFLLRLNVFLAPLISIILYFTIIDRYRKSYLWHFLLLLFTFIYSLLLITQKYVLAKYILILGEMYFIGWSASYFFVYKITDKSDKRFRLPFYYNLFFGLLYIFISYIILFNYFHGFVVQLYNNWKFRLFNVSSSQISFITINSFIRYLGIFILFYCLYLSIYSFIMFIKNKEIQFKFQIYPLIPFIIVCYFIFLLLGGENIFILNLM